MKTNTNYSILFVDDEEKSLKYFKRAFSDFFPILTCTNAADARNILDQNSDRIGILLTDQRMPNEKGIYLLKYARQYHPHIIRLLTTAYSDLNDAIEAVNSGEILRYITKPWDIQNLHTELRNAMQFFILRHERDQLLQEKLSIKHRQTEVNRARDLIIMASGFTHIRNSVQAIASLLLQLPNIKQSSIDNIKVPGGWGLVEKEIIDQLNITNKIILETCIKHQFDAGSIKETIQQAFQDYSDNIDLTIDDLPDIRFNKILLEKMLKGLLSSLLQLNVNNNKIQVSTGEVSTGVIITLSLEKADLNKSSILEIPIELIAAFLICYHHSGILKINSSDSLTYKIELPSDPENTELPEIDNDWLDDIFSRFENWPK